MLEIKEPLIQDKKTLKNWAKGAEERLNKTNPKELVKIKEKVKEIIKDYDPTGSIYLWEIIFDYVKETANILEEKALAEGEKSHEALLSNWFIKMFGEKISYMVNDEDGKPKKTYEKIDEAVVRIINSDNLGYNYMKPIKEITNIPLMDYIMVAYYEALKAKNKIHNFAEFFEKYIAYIIVGVVMIFVALSLNTVGVVIDLFTLLVFYLMKEQNLMLATTIDYKNYQLAKAIDELEEKIASM